jgi:ribosomal protein S18 acetylase RimI-like enzyme
VARADSPDGEIMLTEYFTSRELGFVGGSYRVVRPDPATFEPPAGVFLLVRDDEARVVGCGGVRRIDDDPLAGVRYEVKHLWLRPEARGRGWGRALLIELESRAVAFGARQIVLDTNDSLTAAGALYRSAGYASVPPYNDNVNATTWYAKTLD